MSPPNDQNTNVFSANAVTPSWKRRSGTALDATGDLNGRVDMCSGNLWLNTMVTPGVGAISATLAFGM